MGIALEGRIEKLEKAVRRPCKHEEIPRVVIVWEGGSTEADAERYGAILESCPECSKADHPLMLVIGFEKFGEPAKPEPTFDGHLTIGDGEKLFGE